MKAYYSLFRTHAVFLFSAGLGLLNFAPLVLEATEKEKFAVSPLEVSVLVRLFEEEHYNAENVRTKDYARVTENFLEKIDPEKVYFSTDDVRGFQTAYLDKSVKGHLSLGDIREAHAIYALYRDRVRERTAWVENQLAQWKTNDDEIVQLFPSSSAWLDKAEIEATWGKKLRREWLLNRLRGLAPDAATHTLLRSYQIRRDSMALSDERSEEVFLNCFTALFDPHSIYYSRSTWQAAEGSISRKGIGASVREKNGTCIFFEIIPGGPVALSGKIQLGDRLLSVEDRNYEMVDVVGMPLPQIIDFISGDESSPVSLVILHQDTGLPELVRFVRESVKRPATLLKSFTCTVKRQDGPSFELGVIHIPALYGPDTVNKDSSCSEDLKNALTALDAAGARGAIVDLRGNEGGYLTEAINCAGIFVGDEAIVRVRNRYGEVRADKPSIPAKRYEKPVVVLVDARTVSGAEIVAQALRDFDHALIVGSATAGVGRTQSIVRLRDVSRGLKDQNTGAAKVTVQYFYGADGQPMESRRIQPDIALQELPYLQTFDLAGGSKIGTAHPLPNLLRPTSDPDTQKRAKLVANSARRQSTDADLLYLAKWSSRNLQPLEPTTGNLQSLQKIIWARNSEKEQLLAEARELAKQTEPLTEIPLRGNVAGKTEQSHSRAIYSDVPWISSVDPVLNEAFRVLADSIE